MSKNFLCCPKCHGQLEYGKQIECKKCSAVYPLISGIPILISEQDSVFTYKKIRADWKKSKSRNVFRDKIFHIVDSITPSVYNKKRHFEIGKIFINRIKEIKKDKLVVLSIGNGAGGIIYDQFKKLDNAILLETDVFVSENRQFVSDIHSLPIKSSSIDVVLIEGVLEHVIDPEKAVSEIFRVLKNQGLALCIIPFVVGVHMPIGDYQRFSRLGLIRLFKRFKLAECEPVSGAFMALAYQMSYTFMILASTIFRSNRLREPAILFAKYFGNFLIFWLKYLDPLMRNHPMSKDAAMIYYYIGYKSKACIADREINSLFDGEGFCPK